MNTKLQGGTVNLDDLLKTVTVILDGESHEVSPIDGVGYQLLKTMQTDGNSVLPMYEVVARCLPTVPKERVMSMTAVQIGRIVKLATETVGLVEESDPNAEKPKGKKGAPAAG